MSRLWQPRETRLLSEWLAKNYPRDKVIFRVRLGNYPKWAESAIKRGAPAEIYKVYQRWADAIIITKTDIIIVEAKIRPDPGVISQINLYEQLLPKTPQFADFRNRPIRKIVLMAIRDPEIEELAAKEDIKIVVFSPDWVIDYLKEIKRYRERY